MKKLILKLISKPFFYKIWMKILSSIKLKIDEVISEDKDDIYVVYLSHLNNDVYVCKGGEKALTLYNQLNKLNMLLNRPHIKVFYGKAEVVFKYKLPKVLDTVFTFDATVEEQRNLFKYFSDVPLIKENLCQSK